MKIFEQIGIEQKTGIVFGLAAFLLSLLTGLFSGVSFLVVIIRSVIMAPVFFVVGFGIIIVLKKYVPELYESLTVVKEESVAVETPVNIDSYDSEDIESYDSTGEQDVSKNEEFTELTQKDFTRYKTVDDSGIESPVDTSAGKMGKHIVVQEQFNSYEPKIMAQAIRTMMSKDKD